MRRTFSRFSDVLEIALVERKPVQQQIERRPYALNRSKKQPQRAFTELTTPAAEAPQLLRATGIG
jgi:hypothetical protein